MTIEIHRVSYHSDLAQEMCAEVQQEYAWRYDSDGDAAVIESTDFDPPHGEFFIAFRGGEAVGCGAWRSAGEKAEMKRVYVRPSARREGLARRIVLHLETTAAAAGKHRLILNTGPSQPEAVALYKDMGYEKEPPFGYYAKFEQAIFLGKDVTAAPSEPSVQRA